VERRITGLNDRLFVGLLAQAAVAIWLSAGIGDKSVFLAAG
jgi:hypothetical protein